MGRIITNKILVLKKDKKFVSRDQKRLKKKPVQKDLELELMKEYLYLDHSKLLNKKSFFLDDEIYSTI
ncbi:hypothetical protein FIU87_16205 [Bacillus sp. THAF10]|nr:hypothetical protein FIU87_16205 [Bacillus sp. THAF10]